MHDVLKICLDFLKLEVKGFFLCEIMKSLSKKYQPLREIYTMMRKSATLSTRIHQLYNIESLPNHNKPLQHLYQETNIHSKPPLKLKTLLYLHDDRHTIAE